MAHDQAAEAASPERLCNHAAPTGLLVVGWSVGICFLTLIASPVRAQTELPATDGGQGLYLGPAAGGTPQGAGSAGALQPWLGGQSQNQTGFDGFDLPYGTVNNGTALPPGFTVTPSVGLSLYGNDNAYTTSDGKHHGDLVTTLTPALFATANTTWVTGTLSYVPYLSYSAEQPQNDRIGQSFTVYGTATVVPDRLFINASGFGTLTQTTGGTAPGLVNTTTPLLNKNNSVQTTVLQAAPYYVHHFANTATAQIGYLVRYLEQSGQRAFLAGSTTPYFTSSSTTTQSGYGVIRSGEEFGRLAFEGRALGGVTEGQGVLAGAYNYSGTVLGRYAITNSVFGQLEGGYQDTYFGGTTPVHIKAPIWSVGVRYVPNQDGSVILKYGERNGYNSAYLLANLAVGERTRIFASYTDQIGTLAQQTADLLTTTAVDEQGNPYDTRAGTAPVPVPFSAGFLATQSAVNRLKRGLASITQTWDRDTFTLNAFATESTPLTSAIGTRAFAQKGLSTAVIWSHLLTPTLSSNVYLQYGTFNTSNSNSTSSNSNSYSARVSLTERFSETLTGSLQYLYISQGSSSLNNQSAQNIIIATLRKTF
jgi:uncharacterized protein (PEP-CTERM system associated)